MIVNNAKFEITAVKPAQYPAGDMPDVAFVGRSNVGKSSIINAMLNRKNLARVGATPGKTREINFYNLENKLYFVDLPGYGFAKVSKAKKESWYEIIETYLHLRMQLKMLLLLVDIRHKPTEDDKMMYEWVQTREVQFAVVATKADKIPRGQIKARLDEIKATLGIKEGMVIPFSSETKQGKDELWNYIDSVIGAV